MSEYRKLREPPTEFVLPHDDGKRCARCETFKPWSAFHVSRTAKDGHQTYCIPCGAAAARQSKERNAEAFELRGAEKKANARTTGTKRCTKCGEEKPVLSFYLHRGTADGRTTYCDECQRASARTWREANAEKVREQNARYPKDKKHAGIRSWRLKMYGLTAEDYERMLDEQGGVCAICLLPERYIDPRNGTTRRLAVDHDHVTGENRGLLCGRCNRSIGQFADDHERLTRAAAYLLKAASVTASWRP